MELPETTRLATAGGRTILRAEPSSVLGNRGRKSLVFSSKHLPRYWAEFSCRLSRLFSVREMFLRLAFVALRTARAPYGVLKLAENSF